MSYAKGKNFNVVFLPLRYSAGDTYRGSGLVFYAPVNFKGGVLKGLSKNSGVIYGGVFE